MASENMIQKINYQINREIYSAYLYLSMSSYAESIGLKGFANWFNVQVKEELSHAEKLYKYIFQIGAKVELLAIEAPEKDFISVLDLFERTYAHEKNVTAMIDELVKTAKEENDVETEEFLQWFVKEQIEEEASSGGKLKKVQAVGDDEEALKSLDSELAERK
jgi:ferritin